MEVTKTNELTVAQVILVTSLVAQMEKHLSTMRETWVPSLGWEDSPEKEMATHSSILVWKISWTEEPTMLPNCGAREDF